MTTLAQLIVKTRTITVVIATVGVPTISIPIKVRS